MIIKQAAFSLIEVHTPVTLGQLLIVEDDILLLLPGLFAFLSLQRTNLNEPGLRDVRYFGLLLLLLELGRTLLWLLAQLGTRL